MSGRLFATRYSFDEVRALCIGSYWLDDLSATLSSLAVRVSAQLNLHRCITKMPHAKKECYDRTRLYYQVYLCDHHCSLKHGRPPMTQEWRSLQAPGAFLHSEHSRHTDLALIGQVELWAISRRVFESFGADVESESAKQRLADSAELDLAYGDWQRHWLQTMAVDAGIRGSHKCELYYHEARLALYSHMFRGARQKPHNLGDTGTSLVQPALDSALAIARICVEVVQQSRKLPDMPCYHGSMLSYASMYLVRAAQSNLPTDAATKETCVRVLHDLSGCLEGQILPAGHCLLALRSRLTVTLPELPGSAVQMATVDATGLDLDPSLLSDEFLNMDFTLMGADWLACDYH